MIKIQIIYSDVNIKNCVHNKAAFENGSDSKA